MQGAPIIMQALTGGANYTIWSRSMRLVLRGKHKRGFIDGSCTRDAQEESLRDQWDRCNAIVLSWILNIVSQELQNSLIFFQDARSVWVDLQERFDKVTDPEFLLFTERFLTCVKVHPRFPLITPN